MLDWMLSRSRAAKRAIIAFVDIGLFACSATAATLLTELQPLSSLPSLLVPLLLSVPIVFVLLTQLGLYRAIIRFLDHQVIRLILIAGFATFMAMVFWQSLLTTVHWQFNIVFSLLFMVSLGSSRYWARLLLFPKQVVAEKKELVLIYGAGSAGRQLAQALENGEQFKTAAFIDDDKSLHNSLMLGIKVLHSQQIALLIKQQPIKRILLAIPSATREQKSKIISELSVHSLPIQTIPGMADIVSGLHRIDEFQQLRIEDLLGRDPVKPHPELLRSNIENKVVMVTGAGGSIGAELCRQIIQAKPTVLVLFELSEFALYQIHHELQHLIEKMGKEIAIKAVLGNVQSQKRLENVMRRFRVQTLYHAAAYKHVPMVEMNILEGLRNNVLGTWRCAEAAIQCHVETFVLISTDKAVRPTNFMGASKRLAELILQALGTRQSTTRFCMVRFGNVLGSSGSVVPLFRQQILQGGPVTVTHPEIIRYFMTIPEAAQLVLQAGAMGHNGQVFVLDMGEPVKIVDLAARMIQLMGLRVKDSNTGLGDIAIEFSGLRPGEKLYEELLVGSNVQKTRHPRICCAHEESMPWPALFELLQQLEYCCDKQLLEQAQALVEAAPTAFRRQGPLSDLVDVRPQPVRLVFPVQAAVQSDELAELN